VCYSTHSSRAQLKKLNKDEPNPWSGTQTVGCCVHCLPVRMETVSIEQPERAENVEFAGVLIWM